METVRAIAWFPLLCVIVTGAAAQRTNTAALEPNATAIRSTPYVVLVSLNGFRYDYAKKDRAAHLLAIAAHGASAPDGMIPAYPSETAPNLYTVVTGLYPEHHGIVADEFYSPRRKAMFRSSDPKTAEDGSWYGGVPLWSLAEKEDLRSACLFWTGCEAEIAGERPANSLPADQQTRSDTQRISQAIAWLRLPEADRPHFIAVALADVDRAGREYGPDSPKTAEAVYRADALIGTLERSLDALHLPIDLIIVSDHGMARVEGDWINLDSYVPLAGFTTAGALLYAPSKAAADTAYQKLKAADARFMVYRRANVPAELHFNSNPREGDPIIVARGPYAIRARAAAGTNPAPGQAGFDPFMMLEMRGLFFAEGPDIRRGVKLQPFENVNVYPLIAKILGLKAAATDGNANILSGILATPAAH